MPRAREAGLGAHTLDHDERGGAISQISCFAFAECTAALSTIPTKQTHVSSALSYWRTTLLRWQSCADYQPRGATTPLSAAKNQRFGGGPEARREFLALPIPALRFHKLAQPGAACVGPGRPERAPGFWRNHATATGFPMELRGCRGVGLGLSAGGSWLGDQAACSDDCRPARCTVTASKAQPRPAATTATTTMTLSATARGRRDA